MDYSKYINSVSDNGDELSHNSLANNPITGNQWENESSMSNFDKVQEFQTVQVQNMNNSKSIPKPGSIHSVSQNVPHSSLAATSSSSNMPSLDDTNKIDMPTNVNPSSVNLANPFVTGQMSVNNASQNNLQTSPSSNNQFATGPFAKDVINSAIVNSTNQPVYQSEIDEPNLSHNVDQTIAPVINPSDYNRNYDATSKLSTVNAPVISNTQRPYSNQINTQNTFTDMPAVILPKNSPLNSDNLANLAKGNSPQTSYSESLEDELGNMPSSIFKGSSDSDDMFNNYMPQHTGGTSLLVKILPFILVIVLALFFATIMSWTTMKANGQTPAWATGLVRIFPALSGVLGDPDANNQPPNTQSTDTQTDTSKNTDGTSSDATTSGSTSTQPAPAPVTPKVYFNTGTTVMNCSSIDGLAKARADILVGKKFVNPESRNCEGASPPINTVYYSDMKLKDTADYIAKVLAISTVVSDASAGNGIIVKLVTQ